MLRLLLTRRFPATVVAPARARFDVVEHDGKTPLSPQDLRAALRDHDLILCSHGDAFQADLALKAEMQEVLDGNKLY